MKKIIVEICQNFIGDKEILKRMIYKAKEGGASHAKVQSYLSDELTDRPKFELGNDQGIDRPYQPEYDRLKEADLSDDDLAWFVDECKRVDIKPLITIFTRGRVKSLAQLGWDEVKVASYDCASYPLLGDLKNNFKHLYISTGATYDNEIKSTAEVLGDTSFTFLHCVTKYPTKLEDCNLARMEWLKKFTPSVGYSDHSLVERDGIIASLGALTLGADVIERHFTILEKYQTKDGPVSINPNQLKELVDWSKKDRAEIGQHLDSLKPGWRDIMTGEAIRKMTEEELHNRDYYRGRFATKVKGEWVYNWEDKNIE
jgi:N,N'-diacetyllegionaminate synthase